MNTLYKVQKEPVVPPSKVKKKNFDVPAELESICMKALQKNPRKRYQTAEEFAEDIRAYLSGKDVQAHKYSSWKKAQRFIQRHPTGTLGAFLGTMMIAIGGLGLQALNSANLKAEAQEARAESAEKERALEEASSTIPIQCLTCSAG